MNEDLMKSLRKQLTPQERVILADLWESDARPALTKLFGQRQLQIAQIVLKSSSDHYFTVENRGRSNELLQITHFLSDNLSKTNKERDAK
jgi:hypothetical protein